MRAAANEEYRQLMDGLQFKKAVLDAKEAIRTGSPMTELPDDFVVKGGTNEASMRADGKIVDEEPEAPAPEEPTPDADPGDEAPPPAEEDDT